MTAFIRPVDFRSTETGEACTAAAGVQADPLEKLYAHFEAKRKADEEAEQRKLEAISAEIGHNGGPAIGVPFGLKARWLKHVNEEELRELAKLHVWIEIQKAGLSRLIARRAKIRDRNIRRMRRHEGKD